MNGIKNRQAKPETDGNGGRIYRMSRSTVDGRKRRILKMKKKKNKKNKNDLTVRGFRLSLR
jgi:hypothetical protein